MAEEEVGHEAGLPRAPGWGKGPQSSGGNAVLDIGTKREYQGTIKGGALPDATLHRRVPSAAGVILAAAVSLVLLLLWLLREPWPEHGAAFVFLINERPEDVHLVSLSVNGTQQDGEERASFRQPVSRPSGRASMTSFLISERQGGQMATIHYRIADGQDVQRFDFTFDLIALEQCDVRVWFESAGPRATACIDHRPATYGGVSRH